MAKLAQDIVTDHDHDIFICGPDPMVSEQVRRLRRSSYPAEQVFFESILGLGGDTFGVPDPREDES